MVPVLAAAVVGGACICTQLCLPENGLRLVGAVPGPAYTVTQVQARMAHDSKAWINRQVLVRGIGGGCIPWAAPKDSPCVDEQPELIDTGAAGIRAALPMVCGQVPPMLGFLRQLPWHERWLAGPQILRPGTLAVYRVQLPAVRGYEALLIDSRPSCGAG